MGLDVESLLRKGFALAGSDNRKMKGDFPNAAKDCCKPVKRRAGNNNMEGWYLMNAMELITTGANDYSFKNKNLQNATMLVARLTEKAKGTMFQIAKVIAMVDQTECYKEDGFNSVHEWAVKVLGYRKSMSYDLLKIGTEYTRELTNSNGRVIGWECNLLPEGSEDNFSTTQVIRMIPAGRDTVIELVGKGEITPDMTSKKISEVIKGVIGAEEGFDISEGEEATNSNKDVERGQEIDLSKVSTVQLILELGRRGYNVYNEDGSDAIEKAL